jgi:hypothetical protein
MNDTELLKGLDLGFEDAAKIIGVRRQTLYEGVTAKDGRSTDKRRGGSRPQANSVVAASYLNADRLLAIWNHFATHEDWSRANIVRDALVARHPKLEKLIAPYEVSGTDSPSDFNFSEVWIFSREPIEIQSPAFRQEMSAPLKEDKKRLIYFVPSDEVASRLLTVLRVTAGGDMKEVYIVVTTAVLLCPHWMVAFIQSANGEDEVLAGVMPEPPKGMEFWKRVVRVPQRYFPNVCDTLMQAGLLDASDRFKLPAKSVVGGGGLPQFQIFYPEIK